MVKGIFDKWKKRDAIDGYDDDQHQTEGKVILDRIASIMTSGEANKKDNQVDVPGAQDTLLYDSPIVITKSEAHLQEPAFSFATPDDDLSTGQIPVKDVPASSIEKAKAPDLNEVDKNDPSDRSQLRNRETIPEEKVIRSASGTVKKGQPTILVVEDEPVTQRLIKKILEDRYGVVIAGDGIDALMQIGKRSFDLILSDLSMPNLDGFKLLDLMNMKGIKVPIIFLTGSDDVEDEIKVLALGAKDYIRKPMNRDLLLLRVNRALNQ